MNILTTGTIIQKLGISRSKLLYYEERGYIPRAERSTDNRRIYSADDIPILRDAILKAGFDLTGAN